MNINILYGLLSYFYACVEMLSFLSLYIADRSLIDLIDVLKFNGNQGIVIEKILKGKIVFHILL